MATAVSTTTTQAEKDYAIAYMQVRGLNQSIAAEKARGNVAGVEAMLPLFKSWYAKLKTATAILNGQETTTFDKFLIEISNYVQQAKDAGSNLAGDVGKGVFKAALPFLALAGILLYLKGKF